ncbi:MAG: BspA family leucine-rich repeat surface protein, partial [Chryseotalea sp.]
MLKYNSVFGGTGSFLTRWSTTTGTITIPVTNIGPTYDYNVTWTNLTNTGVGNGSVTGHVGNYTITGLTNGNIYQIEITGNFPGLFFFNGSERRKILSIERWGSPVWTSMSSSFYGCDLLVCNATDAPDVSQVTRMDYAFREARLFNADLSGWNTSNVTTMDYMFYRARDFNGNIGTWNVSKVNTMTRMFEDASSFNQDLNNWDVSKVLNMSYMFWRAELFNGNISNWNTVSVTNMSQMFTFASAFNQNIGNWNVSNVTNMSGMFTAASVFNQDLNNWDVSK